MPEHGLDHAMVSNASGPGPDPKPILDRKRIPEGIPLQAAQISLLDFKQLHPATAAYRHTVAMELKGKLDIPLFEQAMLELMMRHEALRSRFVSADDMDKQVFDGDFKPSSEWPVKKIDARNFKKEYGYTPPPEELPKVLSLFDSHGIIHNPFDLQNGPLWRAGLVQYDENEYQFLMVFDYLIMDPHSQDILMEELAVIYNGLLKRKVLPVMPPKPNLSEVKFQQQHPDEKMHYWKKRLAGFSPNTLEPDVPVKKRFSFKGDRIYFSFSAEHISQLNNFIERLNSSLNPGEPKFTLKMFFLATLNILLYRYTGMTDLCIGTASSTRQDYNQDVSKVVNCFANIIPLLTDLKGNPSFMEILRRVRATTLEADSNQVPLASIIEEKAFAATNGVATPVDIMFSLHKPKKKLALDGIEASDPIELNLRTSKVQYFDLHLDEKQDGDMDGFVEFNADLFTHDYFNRFLGHWKTLLKAVTRNPNAKLADLPILTQEEKQQLVRFNDTDKKPIFKEHVHELFSLRAKQLKKRTGVVFHHETGERQTLSWKELDERTDKLAALLMHMGIRRGKKIGISLSRSINLIEAMLAIHKTGATFVPLDTMPGEALNYKVTHTKLDLVLLDNNTQDLFLRYRKSVPQLNISNKERINQRVKKKHLKYKKPFVSSEDIASIYYTSGSTGNPKGVEVRFGGQKNLLNALADRKPEPGTKYLCVADIKSDAFWFDISEWIATQNAQLHMVDDTERFSPDALTRIIQQEKINTVVLLPHIMAKLNPRELPSIKVAITMGAPPDGNMLAEWRACGIEVRNEWGPTENTVCGSQNILIDYDRPTSIGKPLRNEQIHIVHPDGSICPIGVPGEIVVEGQGLAKGYYRNPSLTKKAFPTTRYNPAIPSFAYPTTQASALRSRVAKHPYKSSAFRIKTSLKLAHKSPCEWKKVYRTGDLAVRDNNGKIIFMDRIDRQTKIKGKRIELNVVEQCLRQHPNVAEVCVIKHTSQDNEESLVAYIVPKQKKAIDLEQEREQELYALNRLLYDSPLPSEARLSNVMHIPKIPLLFAGKYNTKELPAPVEIKRYIRPPQTTLQRELIEVWARILPRNIPKEKIGINHPFYSLGGDSFRFARLVSLINKFEFTSFKLTSILKPSDLREYMTIEDIERILMLHAMSLEDRTSFGAAAAAVAVQADNIDDRSTPLDLWLPRRQSAGGAAPLSTTRNFVFTF